MQLLADWEARDHDCNFSKAGVGHNAADGVSRLSNQSNLRWFPC